MKKIFLLFYLFLGVFMFCEQSHANPLISLPAEQQKNHPELHEILQLFQNKTQQHVVLPNTLQYLLLTEASIALHDTEGYAVLADEALNHQVSPEQLQEAAYQAIPYCGFSHVRPFLTILDGIFKKNKIALPLPSQKTSTPETRRTKGYQTQKRIFGDIIDKGYAGAPKGQLHFQELLSENCFGDYYTRTALSVSERELLTFALLASLGFCEPQLKAHIAGNISMQNTKQELTDCITLLLPSIGYPRSLNALSAINQTLSDKN